MTKPAYYDIKKWTLFGLCLSSIILTLCITVVSVIILNHFGGDMDHPSKSEIAMVEAIIMTVAVLSMGVHLFGVSGTCFQSLCLTGTFSVFSVVATIVALIGAITVHPIFWSITAFQLVVTVVAVLYLLDLRKYRISQDLERAPLLTSQTTPTYS